MESQRLKPSSGTMPVEAHDSGESAFELRVSEGVAQRVERTVEIAQPI